MKNDKWKRKNCYSLQLGWGGRGKLKLQLNWATHLMKAKKARKVLEFLHTAGTPHTPAYPLPSLHTSLTVFFLSVCIGIKNKKSARRGWKWNELLVAGRASCLSAGLGRGRGGRGRGRGGYGTSFKNFYSATAKKQQQQQQKQRWQQQQRLFYMPHITGSMYIVSI